MKATRRFILGITSSLLLSAGLVRAAEHADPALCQATSATVGTHKPAPNCVPPCNLIDPAKDQAGSTGSI